MAEQRTLLTADDFFRQYSHGEGNCELVKGEVIQMPPPGGVHGGTAVNIAIALGAFVREHDLGRVLVETGFHLERQPDTVRGPDVSFVTKERMPSTGGEQDWGENDLPFGSRTPNADGNSTGGWQSVCHCRQKTWAASGQFGKAMEADQESGGT